MNRNAAAWFQPFFAACCLVLILLASDAGQAQDLRAIVRGGINPPPVGDQRTTISASLGKDVGIGPYAELTFGAPQGLLINVATRHEGADGVEWRVDEVGTARRGPLASGRYPDSRSAQFTLPLADFMAARPPRGGTTYFVRARALETPQRARAKPVGFWSEPLVLHYRTVQAPPTKFGETARYRRMRFVLDELELPVEQTGDGKEEFRILGLAQEYHLNETPEGVTTVNGADAYYVAAVGDRRQIGMVSKTIDPSKSKGDGGTPTVPFNIEFQNGLPVFNSDGTLKTNKEAIVEFDLGDTGIFNPRRFLLALSVMERDGGGEIQGWYDSFRDAGDALDEAALGVFDQGAFNAELQQVADKMTRDMIKLLGEALVQQTVSDPYSMIIKMGVAVVTLAASAAAEAEKDDYYGTRATTLDIMSNRVDVLHSLPGRRDDTKEGPVYRLAQEEWRFEGPPVPSSASSWDGAVEIDFHVEFYDQVN